MYSRFMRMRERRCYMLKLYLWFTRQEQGDRDMTTHTKMCSNGKENQYTLTHAHTHPSLSRQTVCLCVYHYMHAPQTIDIIDNWKCAIYFSRMTKKSFHWKNVWSTDLLLLLLLFSTRPFILLNSSNILLDAVYESVSLFKLLFFYLTLWSAVKKKRTKWNQIKCKSKKKKMLKMNRKTIEIDFWPESLDIVNIEVTTIINYHD